MPPLSPSTPNPDLPGFYDPDTYSSVQPGTNPEAFNRLHNEPKRDNVDDNLSMPRWAVCLIVFIVVLGFFLILIIWLLSRNRRLKMARVNQDVELESCGRRSHTPTPSLPELYWPGVFPPAPASPDSDATVFPKAGTQRVPQQPRVHLDKSLPDIPAHTFTDAEDDEDWETVAPLTRDNTFNDAFAQHRLDQERRENEHRDKERRQKERRERERLDNERSLMEALARSNQRERRGNPYELSPEPAFNYGKSPEPESNGGSKKNSPQLHDMKPHVNESYARYRSYRMQLSDTDNDTDVILASDTNTMGPPTTATTSNTGASNPYSNSSGGGMMRSSRDRRRLELTGGGGRDGDDNGYATHRGLLRPPQPARLAAERNFVPPAVSGQQFPSDQSEMDNFTEAMITDDPFVSGGKMSTRQRR
ncbi:hypothetical protein DBV05_g964 [Lasiodiplodia theobromae]|uniref:Uncharacterized protein n=1 Tax=Lasiodiplodia theobromae TaxID=45133 RepID=A0A5N5DRJ6_9PEZI|nr:hypothetical protein DBV05_g964 [Lasiodiplodia theobromae]